MAEKVILEKEHISNMENKLVEKLLKERLRAGDLSAVRLILESLRRIGEYATDVAEVVLNLTVEKTLEDPNGNSKSGRSTSLPFQELDNSL